jgi:hypothetical protein
MNRRGFLGRALAGIAAASAAKCVPAVPPIEPAPMPLGGLASLSDHELHVALHRTYYASRDHVHRLACAHYGSAK